ncbi:RNA polymerase sigma factor (sigma-70 family) [Nocardioides luteus]|uniref:RNA polymerase sigma24 factor n=1 Tax=Nocardioides luteus TaxID=1844 RepID=A0ABQ5SR39_9ACTN|nr:sigma-70 family RNA polymerase sigma factor [Nocardioides luteus]MDR7311081.1 RNA polymerase sigma factor (sigma-70 family) [Nocardioides luteus]GGR68109.1 RNA polymerase sigma24 factor [Nocardioides luteus]GLJ66627.1 RNA polymerase sigma24 factor [Nocardioides luteus]
MSASIPDDLLRDLTPQVVAVVTRRCGDFDAAEDAVQEALIEALRIWTERGVPEQPRGWLITTAVRRLVDAKRSEARRRDRERADRLAEPDGQETYAADDSLDVLLLCCHPSLTPASAVALTLRAVGGLTTREIARAYLVPEKTMAQRISRAKATLKGRSLGIDGTADLAARIPAMLKVLYLLFNEGYVASEGEHLQRVDLCAEAIRLTRMAHRALARMTGSAHGELGGLLALMLLLDARRPARVDAHGAVVPLADQDRSLWRRETSREGISLVDSIVGTGRPGTYQIQAAIAALHNRAASAEETDWLQIAALYGLLEKVAPGPIVTLNKAVAVGYADGPVPALALIDGLVRDRAADGDAGFADHPRLPAVRAHLLELAGDLDGAAAAYDLAAARATNLAERRFLISKAAALRDARC